MCDTFAALPNATTTGTTLLAKSADTEVNECQVLERLPARDWPEGAMLRVTHRLIPQAPRTHDCLINKSFWLYGAEIEFRDRDGQPFDGGTAFLHTAGYTFSVVTVPLQLISIVMMITTERRQGLTDIILGTAAVNRRVI